MKNPFSFLRGERASKTTTEELREAIQPADADVIRAERFAAEAESAYSQSLLNPDAKVSAAARKTADDARVNLDRARALAAALRERLAEVEDEEREAEKQAAYDLAKKAAKTTAASFQTIYQPAAKTIAEFMVQKVRSDLAVARVNANLPAGAEPIPFPEFEIRSLPPEPEQIIDVQIEDAGWFYKDGRGPVEESLVNTIETDSSGKCHVVIKMRGHEPRRVDVVRKYRRIETILPRRDAWHPEPLSCAVHLPGLKPGEAPFWAGWGDFQPESDDDPRILQFLESVEASWRAKPSDPRGPRGPERRFELISEAEAAEFETPLDALVNLTT